MFHLIYMTRARVGFFFALHTGSPVAFRAVCYIPTDCVGWDEAAALWMAAVGTFGGTKLNPPLSQLCCRSFREKREVGAVSQGLTAASRWEEILVLEGGLDETDETSAAEGMLAWSLGRIFF